MNNILWISYYFNPIRAVGSIRNSKLAKYLSLMNFNLYVISTTNSILAPKDDILKKKDKIKKIFRIPTIDYQTIKFLFKVKFKASKQVSERELTSVFQKFPLNILIGEGGIIYIIFAFFISIFIIKRYKIKNVYSTYSPISDHFIALLLKLIFPKLNWVSDFRDLPIFFDLLCKLIFKKADVVTTVSEGLKSSLQKFNNKIFVVRNGFDSDDIYYLGNEKKEIKFFSFLYTGLLYGFKRNPEILFKVLSKLLKERKLNERDLKLIYAGRSSDLFIEIGRKYNLEKFIIDLGFIKREEAIKLQQKSWFLIMLTWSTKDEKGIITGKFYEYLLSNRPIICIVNGEKDVEIENIFKKTKAGIVIYNNKKSENKLKKFLIEQYKNFKRKKFEYNYNYNEVKKYSYQNIAKKLSKILCVE
jgi:hypothetical protein